MADLHYIGAGIYSVTEAEALTGVPSSVIRRLFQGYKYNNTKGKTREVEALYAPKLERIEGRLVLSFHDVIELKAMYIAHKEGVSWQKIREAVNCLRNKMKCVYPFSEKLIKTDGRKIFAELTSDEHYGPLLMDANKDGQMVLGSIVKSSFFKTIEYDKAGRAVRWRPVEKLDVVVDPNVKFGQPVLKKYAIPTKSLFKAYQTEEKISSVSDIYDIPEAAVQQAIDFEKYLYELQTAA